MEKEEITIKGKGKFTLVRYDNPIELEKFNTKENRFEDVTLELDELVTLINDFGLSSTVKSGYLHIFAKVEDYRIDIHSISNILKGLAKQFLICKPLLSKWECLGLEIKKIQIILDWFIEQGYDPRKKPEEFREMLKVRKIK